MPFTEIKTNLIANSAVTQAKIDPTVELGGSSVTSSATAPSTPAAGDLLHDTTNNKLIVLEDTTGPVATRRHYIDQYNYSNGDREIEIELTNYFLLLEKRSL
jgi:hypothetical protein